MEITSWYGWIVWASGWASITIVSAIVLIAVCMAIADFMQNSYLGVPMEQIENQIKQMTAAKRSQIMRVLPVSDDDAVAPIYVNFLMAIYCSYAPWDYVGRQTWNSPAGKETLERLIATGMVQRVAVGDGRRIRIEYKITNRGLAYVHAILRMPTPELGRHGGETCYIVNGETFYRTTAREERD